MLIGVNDTDESAVLVLTSKLPALWLSSAPHASRHPDLSAPAPSAHPRLMSYPKLLLGLVGGPFGLLGKVDQMRIGYFLRFAARACSAKQRRQDPANQHNLPL